MTRRTLTVEQLENAGYKGYEFSNYSMADAVEYIKNGCETRLEPRHTGGGTMVAVVIIKVGVHVYERDMFWRKMTPEERAKYAEQMAADKKHDDDVSARIHARNRARMRRR